MGAGVVMMDCGKTKFPQPAAVDELTGKRTVSHGASPSRGQMRP